MSRQEGWQRILTIILITVRIVIVVVRLSRNEGWKRIVALLLILIIMIRIIGTIVLEPGIHQIREIVGIIILTPTVGLLLIPPQSSAPCWLTSKKRILRGIGFQ